jgi:hypothetical protein
MARRFGGWRFTESWCPPDGRSSIAGSRVQCLFLLPSSRNALVPFQLRQGLAIAGAVCQNLVPELLGLRAVAALGGQHGQVAPGQVPVDPLVEAAQLFGTLEVQDPPPAVFGLG